MATRKTTNGTTNGTTTRSAAAPSLDSATPKKKAAPRTTAARTTSAASIARSTLRVTPEQRHQWICTAAYFMAEHSGFQGNPVEFWLCAEAQVDQQLYV